MKRIIRVFVVEILALYVVSQITTGLSFENGAQGLVIAGVGLAIASFLVKPIVNVLLLPLNLVTFGFFRWVGNLVVLYGVDHFLTQFGVGSFGFGGYQTNLFTMPSLHLAAGITSYIAFSLIISLIGTIIYWLIG